MVDRYYDELLKFVLQISSKTTTHTTEKYCLNTKIELQRELLEKKEEELFNERKVNREQSMQIGALKRELEMTKKTLEETEIRLNESQSLMKHHKNNDIYFSHKRQKLRENHRELKQSLNEENGEDIKGQVRRVLGVLEDFCKNP